MEGFNINRTLYSGRPEDETGRLPKEIRAYDILDSLGIKYFRVDHDAAASVDVCDEVEKILGIHICKNLFLCNAQKTKFYMLVMPGHKKFRTRNLSKQIGSSRLSFADETYMEELLDLTPGSVSVLGLANDTAGRVQLIIDNDILKDEDFGCHPCINTSSLRIKTADIINKFLPAVHHAPVFVSLPWEG